MIKSPEQRALSYLIAEDLKGMTPKQGIMASGVNHTQFANFKRMSNGYLTEIPGFSLAAAIEVARNLGHVVTLLVDGKEPSAPFELDE